nr:MAG TPA: hypothetical protein [Caudoviricetes sp.]
MSQGVADSNIGFYISRQSLPDDGCINRCF